MHVQKFPLSPPSLHELAEKLRTPLKANYEQATVEVVQCPDLRQAPFHLATQGISGDEKIADVGGQPNLFPRPRLDCHWSLTDIASAMDMSAEKGGLLGAGAGPFLVLGQNSELAPNLSWQGGFDNVENQTRVAQIVRGTGVVDVSRCNSVDCGLMVNLFGSSGEPGPVIKIIAAKRKGPEKSLTECVQKALADAYGTSETVSLGGVFLVKSGKALYHIMPDFPEEKDLPFKDRDGVDAWLTYHDFEAPMVCLSVLHSADPGNAMGLRMEHTHCFSSTGEHAGGHYHHESNDSDEPIEYEAYFNTARTIYRVDQPRVA